MAIVKKSISFCITCMNRLHHLKQTLPANIKLNEAYSNLEFIVLDYNSMDGMDAWVKENMGEYISKGIVKYYRTYEPAFFNHCHAKNLALKLGTGEIVCNINADHYTAENFAGYINDVFMRHENIVLTPIPVATYHHKKGYPPGDIWGKVCVKKTDFLQVGGFDERMIKFGSDDIDFVNRLEMVNIKRFLLDKPIFWHGIFHGNDERHSSRLILNKGPEIYINYKSLCVSEVIFLFNDGNFERVKFTDNRSVNCAQLTTAYRPEVHKFRYSTENCKWVRGNWALDDSDKHIDIRISSGPDYLLQKSTLNKHDVLTDVVTGEIFYMVIDPALIQSLSKLNYTFYNVVLAEENLKVKQAKVNPDGFGKATVFKNFDLNYSISVY